jgi:electron transport complex protein RnfD
MIPGIIALVYIFGPGVAINIAIALVVAELSEASVLLLRRRPLAPSLLDYSAALTAVLLAVSLPPLSPWWLTALGASFAIVFGKQLYGGLGYNPFNPAMVGYALLLISFPKYLTAWILPMDLANIQISLLDAARIIFQMGDQGVYDGLAQATPLDTWKTQIGMAKNLDEIESSRIFGLIGGQGWQWVNAGFLMGGLWMSYRGLIDWRIPLSFLGTLFLVSMVFFILDPAYYPNPLFHLFSGASMLGAFFIATDPVSAATTPVGRWIYGALIGFLVIIIRHWGGYPDGVAFAVLLLNFAAPTIDHYSRPRAYGYFQ